MFLPSRRSLQFGVGLALGVSGLWLGLHWWLVTPTGATREIYREPGFQGGVTQLDVVPNIDLDFIASARQTNEELFLLKKLAGKLGAVTDSVPRAGEGDKLLLNADRNPNTNGARLTGICFTEMGAKIPEIARGIEQGKIRTLIVFGEDVTKHGISAELLGKLETLVVSDILPSETTKLAHYLLPGCAHAEKRGTFTNTKGRVQK